jgi:hypothetical protein
VAFGSRPNSVIDTIRANEFQNRRPGPYGDRDVLVLGSSMMSTHNQTKNGAECSKASTQADRRGLIGNDFLASPGYHTRVPWRRALALGRTGFSTGDVTGAPVGKLDACKNPWPGPGSPAAIGLQWFQRIGIHRGLMITEGGLINDQTSRAGGWAQTLAGIVQCSAMKQAEGALNILLAAEHAALNPGFNNLAPPTVSWVPIAPPQRRWNQILDLNANEADGGCVYKAVAGGGRNPNRTIGWLNGIKKTISPLNRLWNGVPANDPVRLNLTALRNQYFNASIKQVWLQYPYMDQAEVALRGRDLRLVLGVLPAWFVDAWGRNLITIAAVDPVLRPRVRQVTDDLNGLMWDAIGCGGPGAAWAPGHPAKVCARAPNNAPMVVITQDAFPGWGAADHQNTAIGGMPHESAAGANKMGAAIVAADRLP